MKYHFSFEGRILFSVKCVHYLFMGYVFKNVEFAIFVSAESTRKAFTGFNGERSYANTESLQKFLVTSTCNFCLIQKN